MEKSTSINATPATNRSFARKAAKASWITGLILILLFGFIRRIVSPIVADLLALLIMTGGLAAGVIALFGIPKQGVKGILAPAAVGLVINGLLLSIFFTNFFAARAKARETGTRNPPATVTTSGKR